MTMRYLALLALPALVAAAPPREDGPVQARALIENYYAAINRGDFRTAYASWENGGQASGKSFAVFREGFAETVQSSASVRAPRNEDAGMSQRWIEVPVDVYAMLKNGRLQHFRGSYTLHRVAPGVGAPARQTHWHIASAKLVAVR
jgi:hypothetical protein